MTVFLSVACRNALGYNALYRTLSMQRVRTPRKGTGGLLQGAEPFSLRGEGHVGCLLVHGFTSTPYDVRACGEYLAARGIDVEAPLLKGHGTSPEDLSRTRLADWLRSIQESRTRLAERTDAVFGLGISLSGNFLLSLAPLTDFDGLILIGTPLRFRFERAYRAAYRVLRALRREYQKKWYVEHLDASIRSRRPTYDRFPLRCAPDCLAAIRWSKENLPRIRCPVLILQSTTDHAVDERTVAEFSARLASSDVTIRWLKNRYHVLLVDHGAEEVFSLVTRFVQTRAPAPELREPVARALLAQPAGSRP